MCIPDTTSVPTCPILGSHINDTEVEDELEDPAEQLKSDVQSFIRAEDDTLRMKRSTAGPKEFRRALTHPEQKAFLKHVQSLPRGGPLHTYSEIDAIAGRKTASKEVNRLGADALGDSSPKASRSCRIQYVFAARVFCCMQ